jgi:DNA polymerase III gamma/tau subunit
MTNLLNAIISQQGNVCLAEINDIYMSGKDLKLYVKDISKYILDLTKYHLTKSFDLTYIPKGNQQDASKLAKQAGIDFLLDMLDSFNKLYQVIKYEQTPRAMIESEVLLLCLK